MRYCFAPGLGSALSDAGNLAGGSMPWAGATQSSPNAGIGRVLTHAEISALGGDPEAFLALDAAPNTTFGAGYGGDYEAPVAVKAMHGYDPERLEMRASLLIFGPTVPN